MDPALQPRGRGRGRGATVDPASVSRYVVPTTCVQPAKTNVQQPPSVTASGDGPRGGMSTLMNRRPRVTFIEAPMDESLVKNSKRSGNQGRPTQVLSNLVALTKRPSTNIYMYDINTSETVRIRLVTEKYNLLRNLQESGKIPKCGLAYDGRMLFTSASLHNDDQFSVDITSSTHGTGKIAFRKVGSCTPGSEQWFRAVNVIVNLCQQLLGQKKYGDNFFVPPSADLKNAQYSDPARMSFVPGRFKLKDQFELLQGYSASLQRAMQSNGTIIPIMHVSGTHRLANLQTVDGEMGRNFNNAAAKMPGRTVLTRYNNKTYSVVDVTKPMSIDSTFGEGAKMSSYRKYFMKKYGIQLTKSEQSFLKLKRSRVDRVKQIRFRKSKGLEKEETPEEILIPSELCYLTGFSEDEKARFQRDRDFNDLCRKAPEKRAEDVTRFVQFLNSNETTRDLLSNWNFEVEKKPLAIPARILPSCYQRNQQFRDKPSLNNNALTIEKPDDRSSSMITIDVFCQCRNFRYENMKTYVESIKQAASKMRFQIKVNDDSGSRSIQEAISNGIRNKVDAVLIIVDDSFRYKEIKTASIEQGILTQVVRAQTAGKPVTAQKVAMQIACKVGFIPWRLSGGLPSGGDFMIVGVDVFSGKGASNVQVAVFSMDKECSRYFTFVNYVQGRNMECITNLEVSFKEALMAYRKRNGKYPSRIFLYRDGVSDSQLLNVQESEIKPLIACLESGYGNSPFNLIVTIVKKRISQRFFSMGAGNRVENVAPGTVIDREIVKPNWVEYFMVPQDAGQGTATPTSFHVLADYNNSKASPLATMSPDDLQRTTFALTHLYYNWTGTIRVPAPVQYAHKCAFLLGQCAINSIVHENIRQKLFYL